MPSSEKKIELALQESEAKFIQIIEQSADGIVLSDEEGRIIEWNQGQEKITGRTRNEVINRYTWDVQHDAFREEDKNQENYNRGKQMVQALLQSGEAEWTDLQLESPFIDKMGIKKVIQSVTSVIKTNKGYMISTISRDITEMKKIEETLRLNEQKYRNLVENSLLGIVIAQDNPLQLLFANQSMQDISGFTPEELMILGPAKLGELIHPDDRGKFLANFRSRLAGEEIPQRNEYRIIRKDGEMRWVDLYSVRTKIGEKWTTQTSFLDITKRKMMEQERTRLDQQFQKSQRLESLGVLAGGIAHDFNNLLASILGNASLCLAEMPSTEPYRVYLGEIEETTKRAAELCHQLLAYSGKGRFKIEILNLNELINGVLHLINVSIPKKISLQFHLDSHVSNILGDSTQMRQILMNLIINAAESIGGETGVINISTGQQNLTTEDLQNSYLGEKLPTGIYSWLEVKDSGSGMTEETMERIFEPFFTTKFTGRGLGLSAVLGIIRSHKGAIIIDSKINKGTTFRILFPPATGKECAIPQESSEIKEWKGSGLILLVDDEKGVRSTSSRMLKHLGFQVLLASNGQEALDLFQKHITNISLVLLDLTMPQMDGEETFQAMKLVDPAVRVLIASGYTETDVLSRFPEQNLVGLIQKPYDLAKLRLVLENVYTGEAN